MKKSKKQLPNPNFLLLSNLSNILGFAMFLPLYGAFIVSLGQKPETGSFLWSAHTLVTGVLVLIFGRIEDKKSSLFPRSLIGGNILQVAGVVGFLASNSFMTFAISLMVYSVGTAILAPAWFTLFSRGMHNKHVARGWSYAQSGAAFSGALGAVIGGFIFSYYGYNGVFAVTALMHFVGLLFAVRAMRH